MINTIETTIITNSTYTNKNVNKVIRSAFSLNNFFEKNANIKKTLFYKKIDTWGSVKEYIFVGFEMEVEMTYNLKSSKNNIFVDSILNSIKTDNAKNSEQFNELANNMLKIVQTDSGSSSSLSSNMYVQQQAKLHDLIESFISSNPDKKSALFNIEVPNYGPFDFYYQTSSWVSFLFKNLI